MTINQSSLLINQSSLLIAFLLDRGTQWLFKQQLLVPVYITSGKQALSYLVCSVSRVASIWWMGIRSLVYCGILFPNRTS